MESSLASAFLSFVVGAALLAIPCRATQYTVGDTSGWDLSTNFNSWLKEKTFNVGDTLVFQYSSMHSLAEVSKADYASCTAGNALKSYSDGNTQISLKAVGTKYFICGTPGHCAGGMKIAIPVKAAASGSPSATPAAKSPSASATPSTPATKSPTTTTTNKSGAAVFSVGNVGLFFGSAAMVAGFLLL